MAKFYGRIGYSTNEETAPGIWEEVIIERNYSGDILKNTSRWQEGNTLNDNLEINNRISIIADPFATRNLGSMRYVDWMGALWKVKNVEVLSPRLIISIGGVYNGPTTKPT